MKKNKLHLLKGERTLIVLIGLLIIGNVLGSSFSMALLSKTNIELESMKSKINKQESVNESLKMKINELASLDNVEEVATLYGLEYNNDNVRIITE